MSVTIDNLILCLEARRSGPRSWSAKCPAHKDRTPSLSIGTGSDGKPLFHCFGGCSQDAVLTALRDRGLWGGDASGDTPARPTAAARAADDDLERINRARDIWHAAKDVRGTVAEQYFRSRAISIELPPTLRFIADAYHTDAKATFPALVAAVTVFPSKTVMAVQRTFLKPDGTGKANVRPAKKALGPIRGGAVRLAKAGERLGLTEGIEDALTVMQLVPSLPCWATLGAKNLASVIVPETVREIVIIADNDESGRREAEAAADRFITQGLSVRIVPPPARFKDFNEALQAAEPKPELLTAEQRYDFEERAAIHEYDAGLSRAEAESRSWDALAALIEGTERSAA